MEMQRLDSAIEMPLYKPEDVELDSRSSTSSTRRSSPDPLLKANTANSNNNSPQPQPPSRLLALPVELQLLIWEYTVISSSPLHINGPCDSSFGGWNERYYADVELWKSGRKKPPLQPALSLVSRGIRAEVLPMFYKHNAFQSGYCYETDMDMTLRWLRLIGPENRKAMRGFYFFDANWSHDGNCPKDLKKVLRGPAVREMGGTVESSYSNEGCRHEVLFGRKVDGEELDGIEGLFAGTSI